MSASLDAMTGLPNSRGRFRGMVEVSRRRVALGRRLSTFERLDAYSMVTWGCTAVGELTAAESASAEGLTQVQPGQEPAWTLHLVTWRIYALTLLGRWEAVAPLAHRAHLLWEEMGRETAGYSLRGFVAAAHIAQSRGESALAERLGEVVETMLQEFEDRRSAPGGRYRVWAPLLHFDRAGLEAAAADWDLRRGVPDVSERLASAMSDRRWPLPASITAPQLEWAATEGLAPLEMQLRRAIGLRDDNETELARAAEIAGAISAQSALARLRFELARGRGDRDAMQAAVGTLEGFGDQRQIGLYLG